jgi:hypothetical protein
MKVTVKFTGANDKRFSKPWIGKVTHWPIGQRAALEWGVFRGSITEGGETEVDAVTGDVIRWGQKDYRAGKHGSPSLWGIVQADASVLECTEVVARKAYDSGNAQAERDAQAAKSKQNENSAAQAAHESLAGASTTREIAKASLLLLPFEDRCSLIDEVLALGSV